MKFLESERCDTSIRGLSAGRITQVYGALTYLFAQQSTRPVSDLTAVVRAAGFVDVRELVSARRREDEQ